MTTNNNQHSTKIDGFLKFKVENDLELAHEEHTVMRSSKQMVAALGFVFER
jgi:hypothetical protein